jgi:hypothetical protein
MAPEHADFWSLDYLHAPIHRGIGPVGRLLIKPVIKWFINSRLSQDPSIDQRTIDNKTAAASLGATKGSLHSSTDHGIMVLSNYFELEAQSNGIGHWRVCDPV